MQQLKLHTVWVGAQPPRGCLVSPGEVGTGDTSGFSDFGVPRAGPAALLGAWLEGLVPGDVSWGR